MTRAAGAASGTSARTTEKTALRPDGGYLERTQRPLTSLLFILPMLLFYELSTGLWGVVRIENPRPTLIAFALLQRFFGFFGATGRYLPAMALVTLLLIWHVQRKDGWSMRLKDFLGMLAESAVLALPLIGFWLAVCYVENHHWLAGTDADPIRGEVAICFGAGVYEEFVFRLLLIAAVSLVLKEMLGVGQKRSTLLAVLAAAILFSFYHYLGAESFETRTFIFRTLAGIYFGALFVTRGFGITVGAHAIYDLLYAFHIL